MEKLVQLQVKQNLASTTKTKFVPDGTIPRTKRQEPIAPYQRKTHQVSDDRENIR